MNIQVDNPVLEVHDLTVSYDKKPVLWDVDFTIPYGNLVGIIGPNGAGKSTLIKAIMNLVPKGSGYVKRYNDSLNNVRHKVSYVPQRESVDWDFPASVLDVVLMGRYRKGALLSRISKKDKEIAYESLKRVNMLDFANRQIAQLSGGQQQRTFLARALAQEADIYLMDEPFAGMNPEETRQMMELTRKVNQSGITIVLVEHDMKAVMGLCGYITVLNFGTLLAEGRPEDIRQNEKVINAYLGGGHRE